MYVCLYLPCLHRTPGLTLASYGRGTRASTQAYDAIAVQISLLCRKEDFSLVSAGLAMLTLLLAIPGLVMRMIGLELGEAGIRETLAEEVAGITDGQQDIAEEIGDKTTSLGDMFGNREITDAVSNVWWLTQNTAAKAINKSYKSRQAAAKRIQRRWRGRGRDSIVAIDDLTTKAVSLSFDPESPVIAAGAPEAPAVDQGRGVVGNLFQRA